MQRRSVFHFVTRVMTFPLVFTAVLMTLIVCKTTPVWGANASPSPDFTDVPPVEPPPTVDQQQLRQSVDISPEPPASPDALRKLGYFYKYRQAVSAMIYGVFDTKVTADGGAPLSRASLLYLFHDSQLHAYEAGADLQSDGSGALSMAYRWISSREKFRPYTKAGIGLRLDPADQMAALLHFENVQIRGATGFERTIKDPMSFRFELGATDSLRSFQIIAGIGLVWAW